MSTPGGRNAIVYNLESPSKDSSPFSSMLSFLRLLRQRYTKAIEQAGDRDPEIKSSYPALLQSLSLAESALHRESLELIGIAEPFHLGVFGPTQSGKSSLINWLTGQPLAVPSPLAGFTVHPQGFSGPRSPGWLDRLGQYFEGSRRLPSCALDPADLHAFGFDVAEASRLPSFLEGVILWDTPDFDSVASNRYQDAVLRIAALVDVVILIVSKDKYGDLTVWEFLRLIEPLAQPTLLVINKTDPESEAALLESIRMKWASFRSDPLPQIVTVPYSRDAGLHAVHEVMRPILQPQVSRLMDRSHRDTGAAHRLIETHWNAWVQPILAEHALSQQWRERLDALLADCLERYQRDYLNHPNHYETFQRALAELLTLLEVPGIGTALHAARRVVTWPMRQLTRLGRAASGRESNVDGVERAVLHQLAQHALIQLSEELLLEQGRDIAEQRWRGGLSQLLSSRRASLLGRFDQAAQDYVVQFRPEIESTARSLYAHLEDHPMVLNSLRATRVTTDAAALGVALHTGGIGVQDFVIAPAILSMTSILAESALGHFMNRAQEQLKRKQLEAVNALLQEALCDPLANLPEAIDPGLRIGISPAQLESATTLR
ncbi:MAG: hypothetical protein RL333_1226 [Pseudomonadota bacterium]